MVVIARAGAYVTVPNANLTIKFMIINELQRPCLLVSKIYD